MRRLAGTFAARIGDKYQIRLTRSNYHILTSIFCVVKAHGKVMVTVQYAPIVYSVISVETCVYPKDNLLISFGKQV